MVASRGPWSANAGAAAVISATRPKPMNVFILPPRICLPDRYVDIGHHYVHARRRRGIGVDRGRGIVVIVGVNPGSMMPVMSPVGMVAMVVPAMMMAVVTVSVPVTVPVVGPGRRCQRQRGNDKYAPEYPHVSSPRFPSPRARVRLLFIRFIVMPRE